nr:hypothetical protein TetV2_00586 [Oceanusvirus sp.]
MDAWLLGPFEMAHYKLRGRMAYENLGIVPVQKYRRTVPRDASIARLREWCSAELFAQLRSCRSVLPDSGYLTDGEVIKIEAELETGETVPIDDAHAPANAVALYFVCDFLPADDPRNEHWWTSVTAAEN